MQKAILCDIDGTLAKMNDRSPFDWAKVGEDDVNLPIKKLLDLFNCPYSVYEIILMSGRDEVCRKQTELWLLLNGIHHGELFMRPAGDNRKDSIVKKELYEKHIKEKYEVLFVLDDRNQVVEMWRNELGLTCLQVAEGNF